MCEIILVILLAQKLAAMVREKGRSPVGFVVLFVALWIVGELVGAVVGVIVTLAINQPGLNDAPINPLAYGFALAGAAIGAGIGFAIVMSLSPLEEARRPRLRDIDDEDDEDDPYERRRRRPRSSSPDDDRFTSSE